VNLIEPKSKFNIPFCSKFSRFQKLGNFLLYYFACTKRYRRCKKYREFHANVVHVWHDTDVACSDCSKGKIIKNFPNVFERGDNLLQWYNTIVRNRVGKIQFT